MLTGKTAVLLLLVVTTISLDPVNGCWLACNNQCKVRRKNHILLVCGPYILKSNPAYPPTKDHLCCEELRTLQTNAKGGMQCVIDMLTRDEMEEYDTTLMLNLARYCTKVPSAAPHEVMV
ncbi:unnamed protein product [Urochloa decumbens]|uniref:Uncharacterized protein n=1 Tax=Urochloa decumbens TaxID=240449 RepID=A0ABC9AUX3_9POAL